MTTGSGEVTVLCWHLLYDHWKRGGDSVVLASLEGEIEDIGRRGRRAEWIDNIKEWRGGLREAHQ